MDHVGCVMEQQRKNKEQKAVVAALALQGLRVTQPILADDGQQAFLPLCQPETDVHFSDQKRGDYDFLSPFYPSIFEDAEGLVYTCAGQWMMASKARLMGD